MKIGSHLLVIAAFGALTMQTGLAQEAGAGPHDDGKAVHHSGDDANGPAEKHDVNAADSADKNPAAIDSRIALPPWRHAHGHARRTGDPKTGGVWPMITAGTPHHRTNVVRRPAQPAVRNAIGVQVVRPEGLERHQDRGSFVAAHAAVTTTDGTTGGTSGATHIDGAAWYPPSLPHPNPVVRSTAMSRGSISGTWLAHRGPIPASLGGPNSAFGGISGTMIRPKH